MECFFSKAYLIEKKYEYESYIPEYCKNSDVDYVNGILCGLLRKKDEDLLRLVNTDVDKKIIRISIQRELEIDILKCKLKTDIMSKLQMNTYCRMIGEIQELQLEEWINKHYGVLFCKLPLQDEKQVRNFVYLYCEYRRYKRERDKESILNLKQEEIERVYENKFTKSSVYKRYGLIPVDDNRKVLCIDPPRIYDLEEDITVFLCTVLSNSFVKKLVEMKKLGMIGDLAFHGDDSKVYHGKNDIGILQEALETGRIFEQNAVKALPGLSKLYSQDYEDNLWVHHNAEKSEITFEEMKKDFTISGEKVVTQVIHLKYKSETTDTVEKFVITHIDHEYILYTDESYITRATNGNTHGQNKIKTFKADHARIPFDYPCQAFENSVKIGEEPKEITVPFIYYVLNNFFEHKDLLREYFENILK